MVAVRLERAESVDADWQEKTYIDDISPHGARVITKHSWQAGDVAKLTSREGRFVGQVVYCQKLPDDRYAFGVHVLERPLLWSVVERFWGTSADNLKKKSLRTACKRAGLLRIDWHTLRHTHGTLLHFQGTPLKVAQAQLGHSHTATTLEVCTHASANAQRDAVNLLEDQLFPNVPKFDESGNTAQEKPQLLQ